MQRTHTTLKMLPMRDYYFIEDDPIRFYFQPIVGRLYRRRVELVLEELKGGRRVLDVGYGSGVAFLNLNENYKQLYGADLFVPPNEVKRVFQNHGISLQLKKSNILDLPYENDTFECVIAISILEHLKPRDQGKAFAEMKRVLKPGGQLVYGVPVERPLMVFLFKILGVNIHDFHFSTEKDVAKSARSLMNEVRMKDQTIPLIGSIYEVGHFTK